MLSNRSAFTRRALTLTAALSLAAPTAALAAPVIASQPQSVKPHVIYLGDNGIKSLHWTAWTARTAKGQGQPIYGAAACGTQCPKGPASVVLSAPKAERCNNRPAVTFTHAVVTTVIDSRRVQIASYGLSSLGSMCMWQAGTVTNTTR